MNIQSNFASSTPLANVALHRRSTTHAIKATAQPSTNVVQPQFSGLGSVIKKGLGTVALVGGGLVALLTGVDMGLETYDRIQEDRPLIEDGENALSQYGEQIGFLIGGAGVSAVGGKLSRQADNEA